LNLIRSGYGDSLRSREHACVVEVEIKRINVQERVYVANVGRVICRRMTTKREAMEKTRDGC
jgi:hypothetical protein